MNNQVELSPIEHDFLRKETRGDVRIYTWWKNGRVTNRLETTGIEMTKLLIDMYPARFCEVCFVKYGSFLPDKDCMCEI